MKKISPTKRSKEPVVIVAIGHDAHTRPLVARLHELRELILSGKCPNCNSLAIELEISVRTVMRDIDFLRDRGEPIYYDSGRRGYRYSPAQVDGTGHHKLMDLELLTKTPGQPSPRSQVGKVISVSASFQDIIYDTLGRIGRWEKHANVLDGMGQTYQLGILFKGLLIFECIIGRSVTVLCSMPVGKVRIDDLRTSNVLQEQISALPPICKELTPVIRARLPEFLGSRELLGTDDLTTMGKLYEIRARALTQTPGEVKLAEKANLLPTLLIMLKTLCESRFITCVVEIESKMKLLSDQDGFGVNRDS